MHLADLITDDACILKLSATTKEAAIKEIASHFTDETKTNEEIAEALLEREEIGSTVISNTSMAIPHARHPGLQDFYLGIGISPEGIPTTDSLGKAHKTHVFFVIASQPLKNQLMLNIMAALATKIKSTPDFISRLVYISSKEALLKEFDDIHISPKVKLTQIIQKDFTPISPQASLKDAVSTLAEKNLYFMPVLDEKNQLLGEITSRDILLFAVPDYLISMDNFRFVVEDEPFERFLMQEKEIPVKEVMNTDPFLMTSDTPIIEGVSIMLKEKQRYIYVVDEQKKLVGILTLKDVLKKILFA